MDLLDRMNPFEAMAEEGELDMMDMYGEEGEMDMYGDEEGEMDMDGEEGESEQVSDIMDSDLEQDVKTAAQA